ncbi:phage portal protein [Chitinophaga sp. Hz27]|uniref:phage portal protein n=1 Tax=Chitinophaga sp. Hz27 TaxID=3347169 RepID=UPI0035DC2DF5
MAGNWIKNLFSVRRKSAVMQFIGNQLVMYPDKKSEYIRKGYTYNDIVYSVVRIQLDKIMVPGWAPYDVIDEKAYQQYQAIQKSITSTSFTTPEGIQKLHKDAKMAFYLRSKALQPSTDGRLAELMKWPNQDQSYADFIGEACGFKLVTGDKFISAELAGGGLNTGKPLAMYNQPSDLVNIVRSDSYPFTDAAYNVQLYGVTGVNPKYAREEMLHEKYWNPEYNIAGTQLYGMAPLKATLKRVHRNNEAQLRGLKAFQNGGADGVVYIDDPETSRLHQKMAFEQIGALKNKWDSEFSGADKAGKAVWSGYKMGWTRIGLSPVELAILESEKWDMRMICNVFGVPSQLLNDPENKSYNNSSEGEKALTARCALPLLIAHRESTNRKLQTDWGYKGTRTIVDFDMTAFSELEENKKDQVAWLKDAWWLTGNQKLQIMGEPESKESLMNEILVPNNLAPLSDLSIQAPDLSGDLITMQNR